MKTTYWILTLIFTFFLGAVCGWVLEVFYRRFNRDNIERKWINPGFLRGPYLPIYGFGTIFLTVISTYELYFVKEHDLIFYILFFFVSAVFMTFMELVSGLVLLKTSNLRLWDYRNEKFNYKGVICLRFSIYWGFISIFYYFVINPFVLERIYFFVENIEFSYFVGIISGFFIIDLWTTTDAAVKIRRFARDNDLLVNYEEFNRHITKQRYEIEHRMHFFSRPNKETLSKYLKEKYGKTNED